MMLEVAGLKPMMLEVPARSSTAANISICNNLIAFIVEKLLACKYDLH